MTDLMPTMPKYEAYKDSGVEWIGEIPRHWEVNPLTKYATRVDYRGKTPLKVVEGIFLVTTKNIKNGVIDYNISKEFISINQYPLVMSRGFPIIGDLLFTMEAPLGMSAVVDNEKIAIAQRIIKFRFNNNKFVSYFSNYSMQGAYFQNFLQKEGTGSTAKGIKASKLNKLKLITPPIEEQITIANFLDCKTAKIDQAVAIKEKQIQLLKERKQILIQNAVTKGLDPNAPMRDSGVEWIGETPAHWHVKRLKYILDERKERSKTGTEPLFMVSQTHGLVVRSEYHEKEQVAQSNIDNKIVYKNDLVFNKLKPHLGVFFRSSINFKGIVSPDYAVYKSKGLIRDLKYLEHLFRHPAYIGQFIIRATGIVEGLIRLYTGDLFEISIPVPSKNEQNEILSYIQIQAAKIDKAIAIQEQMIEKLKEYKATLINSAVTGKIKVPQTGEQRAVA